ELEIHISTLNVGQSPHEPHKHVHEELLIVKEGTLETFQSGETRRAGPGAIISQASNEMHNVRNVGTTPATYYVIGWTVPGAARWEQFGCSSSRFSSCSWKSRSFGGCRRTSGSSPISPTSSCSRAFWVSASDAWWPAAGGIYSRCFRSCSSPSSWRSI